VDSLNDDKSYERMLLEMLAADELAPEDTNATFAPPVFCSELQDA
jgi:hypothetical protein